MSEKRIGDWMQCRSGRKFWPLDPRPEDVCIEDIAWALSMLCRFGGHPRTFYSVAQHSVHVSRLSAPAHALRGLLHDASEAYIQDVVSPLKVSLGGYKAIEDRVMRAVWAAVGDGGEWWMPESVRRADEAALATEERDLFDSGHEPWNLRERPDPLVIVPLSPEAACQQFTTAYKILTGR